MADFEQEPDLVQVQQPEADEGLEESLAEFFQTHIRLLKSRRILARLARPRCLN